MRIIIGPKFDMLVKLDGDHEELNFTEELVNHSSRGTLRKTKNTMCISMPIQTKIQDSFSTPEVAMILFLRGKPRG